MTIFFEPTAPIIVQGITGRYGDTYTRTMIEYGTHIVGGVTPGKGGEWLHGLPIFDTVQRAVEATDAEISMVAVPAEFAVDAIFEALNAHIQTVICVTEGIPARDVMRVANYATLRGARLLGPSSAGFMVVGEMNVGLLPTTITLRGSIGIVARGGSLLYFVSDMLQQAQLGMSALISVGSDLVNGVSVKQALEQLEGDANTDQIILLSERGADDSETLDYVQTGMTKPVVGMVTGLYSPHSAKLTRNDDVPSVPKTAEQWQHAGVRLAAYPEQLIPLLLNREE
jgi:succinyl-CoA synthetase alpha subunit